MRRTKRDGEEEAKKVKCKTKTDSERIQKEQGHRGSKIPSTVHLLINSLMVLTDIDDYISLFSNHVVTHYRVL